MLRYAPGTGDGLLTALDAALSRRRRATSAARPPRPARNAQSVRDLAEFLTSAGEDVVILYGERLLQRAARRRRRRARC